MRKQFWYDVEYTDTYGGEANYCWVERATFRAPEGASNRTLMRRARAALGIHCRGRWSSYGDMLVFDPYRSATRAFVTFRERHDVANTKLVEWAERDRMHVCLETNGGDTIVEWWDDDARQAIEDGFLRPRDLHASACEYANSIGA